MDGTTPELGDPKANVLNVQLSFIVSTYREADEVREHVLKLLDALDPFIELQLVHMGLRPHGVVVVDEVRHL